MGRSQVKLVVVGSVDHGKSTLIGRLLYDTGSLSDAQMADVRALSAGPAADGALAFLLDHFAEEQSGRMTIDTAQAFFSSGSRDYVIIDAPGHKEFVRNMITGASQASAALLLLDVAEGVTEQTRRHAAMLSLLGLTQMVVVVNKMDVVGFAHGPFRQVAGQVAPLLGQLNLDLRAVVPASALKGDNVARPSERMTWHGGPTVLGTLDLFQPPTPGDGLPMRLPVQDIYDVGGRTIAVGRVASGTVRVGERVIVCPTGREATVARLEKFERPLEQARAGESIGFSLVPGGGPKRGQVLCSVDCPVTVSRRVLAHVLWMAGPALARGQRVTLRLGTQEVRCRVEEIRNRLDSGTLTVLEEVAEELRETEMAQVRFAGDEELCWDRFAGIPEMGRLAIVRGADIAGAGILP